jgi:hypothetical protein
VKNADNVDVAVQLYQVGYPIVFVEENPNLAGLLRFISLPQPGSQTSDS